MWQRWCVTRVVCMKDGVWQRCAWKTVSDEGVFEKLCVTNVCDKAACNKRCVTNLRVEDVKKNMCDKRVWKMVWDKPMHDTQACLKHGVYGKLLACKVMCDRWCVTKLNVTELLVKDAVWQSCVPSSVWKIVCDKGCVWQRLCVKVDAWHSDVWQMACDEVMCNRFSVTKLCLATMWRSCVWKMVWDAEGEWQSCTWKGARLLV